MKVTEIPSVLDFALQMQQSGNVFVPMFTGDAGIGKSEISQQWAKEQQKRNPDFGFIDLRSAFLEPPDVVGLPFKHQGEDGVLRMSYAIPDFWPSKGEGLLLLEEPNRGMLATMNAFMQLLTDRKVHGYTLPEGWIIAACINPESKGYDVSTMDPALKNRFVEFKVEYDHKTALEYMRKSEWNELVVGFVNSDLWNFKTIEEVKDGEVYVSPRSLSKLNMLQNGKDSGKLSEDVFYNGVVATLGSIAKDYNSFINDNKPITLADILADKKGSLKKLEEMSKSDHRTDNIRLTIDSVKQGMYDGKIDEHLYFEVLSKVHSEDLVIESVKSVWLEKKCLTLKDDQKSIKHSRVGQWLDTIKEAKRVKEILISLKPKAQEYVDNASNK